MSDYDTNDCEITVMKCFAVSNTTKNAQQRI